MLSNGFNGKSIPRQYAQHKAIAERASRNDGVKLVIIVTKEAKVNAAMKWGWTALMMASREGHLHVVQALLANRAPMQMPRRSWAKPL